MTDIKYNVLLDESGAVRRIDMAKDKMFTWLAGDTFARSRGGSGGAHLEQGRTYDVAGFDPAVVAEWVRVGAAKYTDGKKPVKEDA